MLTEMDARSSRLKGCSGSAVGPSPTGGGARGDRLPVLLPGQKDDEEERSEYRPRIPRNFPSGVGVAGRLFAGIAYPRQTIPGIVASGSESQPMKLQWIRDC